MVFCWQESRQAATGGSPDYAHIEAQKMQQLLQAAEADEGWLNKVVGQYSSPLEVSKPQRVKIYAKHCSCNIGVATLELQHWSCNIGVATLELRHAGGLR